MHLLHRETQSLPQLKRNVKISRDMFTHLLNTSYNPYSSLITPARRPSPVFRPTIPPDTSWTGFRTPTLSNKSLWTHICNWRTVRLGVSFHRTLSYELVFHMDTPNERLHTQEEELNYALISLQTLHFYSCTCATSTVLAHYSNAKGMTKNLLFPSFRAHRNNQSILALLHLWERPVEMEVS